jgi:solute carrier family 25 (mitochondrial S-adenosylmethionine transporter), member 26
VSIFVMYPLDAIKTRLQINQASPFRVEGLFKGVTGSLLGQVPYGVLAFGSYEMYKKTLLERFPNTKPIWLYAISAVLGDLTGSFWLCPSEVVKQQVQAGMHPSTGAAVAAILKNKGMAGFYEGYVGGISRDVPFRVAQLTTFEVTKNILLKLKRKRLEPSRGASRLDAIALTPLEAAVCGAIAGSVSAAITSPLDRIKTLLMTSSQDYGGNVLACASKIWKVEGIAGIMTKSDVHST